LSLDWLGTASSSWTGTVNFYGCRLPPAGGAGLPRGQEEDELHLEGVGVLELVHEEVLEAGRRASASVAALVAELCRRL